jgi:hypothetical protein
MGTKPATWYGTGSYWQNIMQSFSKQSTAACIIPSLWVWVQQVLL